MAAILRSGQVFQQQVVPEVESYIKRGHAVPYILSFCSRLQLKYLESYGYFKSKFDLIFWHRNIII